VTAEPGWMPAGREQPRVDDLGFDTRLMSADRLLRLAGKHPMRFSETGLEKVYLDCTSCNRAIENLTDQRGGCYTFTAGQLLANVLRHLVMRHDLSLAGGNGNERAPR